jgi:hypothetical protein
MRMHHNLIYCLPGFAVFLNIIPLMERFSEKVFEHKMHILNFAATYA